MKPSLKFKGRIIFGAFSLFLLSQPAAAGAISGEPSSGSTDQPFVFDSNSFFEKVGSLAHLNRRMHRGRGRHADASDHDSHPSITHSMFSSIEPPATEIPMDFGALGEIADSQEDPYCEVPSDDPTDASVVPEPAPLALFGIGLLGFYFSRRRLVPNQ